MRSAFRACFAGKALAKIKCKNRITIRLLVAGLGGGFFLPAAEAALVPAAEGVEMVAEMPPARHPQLVYWFWQKNTLTNGQYLRDVGHMAKDSPFTFTFLTDRGANFYDFDGLHGIFAQTVAKAHANGLKVGLQLWPFWTRGYNEHAAGYASLTANQALAFVTEGERVLDEHAHADYTVGGQETGDSKVFHREVLKAFAFRKTADGFYEPGSLVELDAATVKTANAGDGGVTVTIDAPAGLAGRSVYILAAHFVQFPDLFNGLMTDSFRNAFEHYRDIPFDGTALDEFGYPLFKQAAGSDVYNRPYGHAFAAAYQKQTGDSLERALFDMRYAPAGRPEVRLRAINNYFDVLREGPLRVESAFHRMSREFFGTNAFAGIHNTWRNHLNGPEIWRTGLNWWLIPRDYGQSDEDLLAPERMGLLVARSKPVMYDQYYGWNLDSFLEKAFRDARFGGRLHYHAWNDTGRWGINIAGQTNLDLIRRVEDKIRLLNQFDPAAPKLPLLVVFGMPAQINWYPDAENRSGFDINKSLGIEDKAKVIWDAGYPCAMVPSDLIDNRQLTLDAENHPVINGHRFAALVYLYPQYAKPPTLQFLEGYARAGGKLMLEGTATHDFSGEDIRSRFEQLAARATVNGFDVAKLGRLGVQTNRLDGGAFMEDGSVVFTDFGSWKSGVPKSFKVRLAGHEFSGGYVGVCALKVTPDGRPEKFACGGFSELRRDGQVIISQEQPADLVITCNAHGEYHALVVAPRGEDTVKLKMLGKSGLETHL